MHLLSVSVVAPSCASAISSLSAQYNNDEVLRVARMGIVAGQQHEPVGGGHRLKEDDFKFKFFAPALMAAAVVTLSPIFSPPVSLAQTIDVQKGATLFRRACIGCHDAGGNIIQPGATLFLKDLLRNGVDTEEEIYKVTYSGKGRMPGFGENCTPRGQCTFGPRLSEDEIKLLADFVKLQANQDWPAIETTDGE